MRLIAVKSLALTPGADLFRDLSRSLSPGNRLGLIAANGGGKSSLQRCLAEQMKPTAGEIARTRGLTTALVEQDLPAAMLALTLREAVAMAAVDGEEWRGDVVLNDLAVPEALRDGTMAGLSGGWKRTTLLARAAVQEPDVYLLDEPTNHLDLARIGRLQGWLTSLPSTPRRR